MKLNLINRLCLMALLPAVIASIPPAGAHEAPAAAQKPYRPLSLDDIERFHGHLGPSVILGVRMGEDAVLNHSFPRCFGIKVEVVCDAAPPGSCLLDGIQLSTGATLGKANIERKDGDAVEVTMRDEKRKARIQYRIKDTTRHLLDQWKKDSLPVDEQARKIYGMKAADLFEIKESTE